MGKKYILLSNYQCQLKLNFGHIIIEFVIRSLSYLISNISPLGKARTLMTRKKETTTSRPILRFLSEFSSSLFLITPNHRKELYKKNNNRTLPSLHSESIKFNNRRNKGTFKRLRITWWTRSTWGWAQSLSGVLWCVVCKINQCRYPPLVARLSFESVIYSLHHLSEMVADSLCLPCM